MSVSPRESESCLDGWCSAPARLSLGVEHENAPTPNHTGTHPGQRPSLSVHFLSIAAAPPPPPPLSLPRTCRS